MDADPHLWKKVDRGKYQLVFAPPEVLVDPLGHFLHETIRKPTFFYKNLVTVAVDECHLMWTWEDFRSDFQRIGDVRNVLWEVPFVCLSATLTPNVQAYVHEVTKLKEDTILFNLSTRRDNINIAVFPMNTPTDLQPLTDLIPHNIQDPLEIPKTLIFVDDITLAKQIAEELRGCLPPLLHGRPPEVLIRTYWASIDDPKKKRTYNCIRSGAARIAVCTDAFGLGINIPDIECVIQWDVTEKLSLDKLYQRVGRAGRARPPPDQPRPVGNGYIFVKKTLLEAVTQNWESAWCPTEVAHESPESSETMEDVDPFRVVPVTNRCLPQFGLPVTEQTSQYVNTHLRGLYRSELDAKAAHREAKKAGVGTQVSPLTMAQKIDPAVLWVIATTGCRHKAILEVFRDPDRKKTDHISWCCDVCAYRNNVDGQQMRSRYPLSRSVSYIRTNTGSDKIILIGNVRNPPVPNPALTVQRPQQIGPAHKEYVEKIINKWRVRMLEFRSLSRGIIPSVVLPDKVVLHLAANIKRITNEPQLLKALETQRYDIECAIVTRKELRALLHLIDKALQQRFERDKNGGQGNPRGRLCLIVASGGNAVVQVGQKDNLQKRARQQSGVRQPLLVPLAANADVVNHGQRPPRAIKTRDIWEGELGR